MNKILEEGAVAIAAALRGNGKLIELRLIYNNIGNEGKRVIQDAVRGRGFKLII